MPAAAYVPYANTVPHCKIIVCVVCFSMYTASLNDCPIGWEHSGCASACPTTCEDYLRPQPKPCIPLCVYCECPQGMVVFRDRCVDPLECYTLVTGVQECGLLYSCELQ